MRMKKIALSLAFLSAAFFAGVSSVSAKGYGTAGCGLGSIVFGDKPGMVQVLAATTNGTRGSQTFGITSGTSNCTADGIIKAEVEQKIYAHSNFESLKQDMARGQGEALTSLAYLMGCSADSVTAFSTATQQKYSQIISGDSDYMLQQVRGVIASDKKLAKSCKIAN